MFQNKIPLNLILAGIVVSALVFSFSFGVIFKIANDANVVGLPELRGKDEKTDKEPIEIFTKKNVRSRYHGQLANNSTMVKTAQDITLSMCDSMPSRECYGSAIFKFVNQTINCTPEKYGEKDLAAPETVLESRKGSSEDIALLTSSLLNAVGIKSAIVVTPDESFVIYTNPDALSLYEAVWRVYRERYTELNFKVRLKPNVPQRILIDKDYSLTPLLITAKSDHPINFISFKTESEADRYIKGNTYTPVYSGTRWSVVSVEINRRIQKGSMIVVESSRETDVSIKGIFSDEEQIWDKVKKDIALRKSPFGNFESVIVLSFKNGPDKKNRMIGQGTEGMDSAIANRTFTVLDMDVLMGM